MTEDKEMIVQIIEKPGTVGTLKAAKLKDLILAFAAAQPELMKEEETKWTKTET